MRVASLLCATLLVGACSSNTPSPAPTDAGNDLAADLPVAPDASPDTAADAAVDARPPLANPFSRGPYGTAVRDLAGPFTVPTTDGDWSFEDHWTGEDSYVFLTYAPRALVFSNGTDYSASLFDASLTDLLDRSPRNVHYFFLWSSDEPGFNTAREAWQSELSRLSETDRAWWTPRIHFVTARSLALTNWIGTMLTARARTALPYKRYDPIQFAIDRTQRIREVGQLGRLAAGGLATDLTFLANEPAYYNFEYTRAQRLAAERDRVTVVELARTRTVHDTLDVDANLPSADAMARFDTLEIDLSMECPNHRDGECGAWDYLSHLRLCTPAPAADGGVDGGGDAGDASSGPAWRCDREIARWITTYWREGRWVTDITPMLALLQSGGATHLRWDASGQWDPRSTDYVVSLSLRLSNRNRGVRPVAAVPLWTGAAWNATYDSDHAPVRVTVPEGTRRAELYTLVTGHGGVQPTNCAEFCNHEHRIAIDTGAAHVKNFPEARSADGCAERVGEGVVPNQHGTWYFGRGGWCPGLDVGPWSVDVTSELAPGTAHELRYTTAYNGRPVSSNLGNIELSSYLIYYR